MGGTEFIIKYAGLPVKLSARAIVFVKAKDATGFGNEVEAWLATKKNNLVAERCRVISRDAAFEEEG